MEPFIKLFGDLLVFVYHCFDRIVIHGYLSGLSRPEQVAYFFRQVVGVPVIGKEVLSRRSADYQNWVEAFARNHDIPIEWALKGVRKEDHVRPWLRQMVRKNAYGVYFIFKSMEQGPTFRITVPKFPTRDPNHRILARQKSRFTHNYFYIRDEVLGPMVMRVATFFPFQTTYYLNGHSFIEQELNRAGIGFRKNDNAFLAVDDAAALQAAADRLSPAIIRERLDYWTFVLGPKFSAKERKKAQRVALLLDRADRVLPQLHLQAALPDPQAVREELRARAMASHLPQDLLDLRAAPQPRAGLSGIEAHAVTNQLTKITDAVVLERTIRGVRAALGTGSSETRFARAEQVIIEAKAALPPPRRFDEVLGARRMLAPRAHFALLIDSTIATGAAAAMKRAAGDFERSVSMVTGIRPRKLPHVELRWLRQRRVTRSKEPEPRPPQSVMRSDYQRLSRSTPMARSHVGSLADYARTAPWQATDIVSWMQPAYIPTASRRVSGLTRFCTR